MKLNDYIHENNLKLVPMWDTHIRLGDKVHDPVDGDSDMPDRNIGYDLMKHGIITKKEKIELLDKLTLKPKKIEKHSPEKLLINIQDKADLKIPGIGNLSGQLDYTKEIRCVFRNLKVKALEGSSMEYLKNYIGNFSKQDKGDYEMQQDKGFSNWQWVHLVTRLVYADIHLTLDASLKGDMEVILNRLRLEVIDSREEKSFVKYFLNNSEAPFAMKLRNIGHFI